MGVFWSLGIGIGDLKRTRLDLHAECSEEDENAKMEEIRYADCEAEEYTDDAGPTVHGVSKSSIPYARSPRSIVNNCSMIDQCIRNEQNRTFR